MNRHFFQRRIIDDQHENMYSIAYQQRNANQKHNDKSLTPVRMPIMKKNTKQQILKRIWRKGNLHTLLVGV